MKSKNKKVVFAKEHKIYSQLDFTPQYKLNIY